MRSLRDVMRLLRNDMRSLKSVMRSHWSLPRLLSNAMVVQSWTHGIA